MYAIAFDMSIKDLELYYGKPYNNAYYEISYILEKFNFYRTQGSVYISEIKDMSNLMEAIQQLSEVEWFANSVKDIRAFRVEDWSNFTRLVKKKATK